MVRPHFAGSDRWLSESASNLPPPRPPKVAVFRTTMEPILEDLADGPDSLSISSTITATTTTTTTRESTSSAPEPECPSIFISTYSKVHHPPQCDACYQVIQRGNSGKALTLADLHFLHRLGSGDIGTVYLVELKQGNGCLFAAKIMDKMEMASRNKESRATTEREILELLDHPFLPTLYLTLDSPRWSCLLTEFCPGGDLHVLRQQQPGKRFNEAAVRFYASEIVAAFEYLHMMGIIYRDLKPENVLVRSDGHIMLTDFDLSLKDDNTISTVQIVPRQTPTAEASSEDPYPVADASQSSTSSCMLPNCIAPAVSCFHPLRRRRRKRPAHRGTPEIVAEPIKVRSMSFVGTHEYLAPEVISGEGHGSAVDWWTLGVFIFEMLYGVTPFKGFDHELTLANIVARALEFPKEPTVPGSAKDLITQLLVKDPVRRLGSTMGATAIKRHQFFDGVNWALLRCRSPPYVPSLVPDHRNIVVPKNDDNGVEYY